MENSNQILLEALSCITQGVLLIDENANLVYKNKRYAEIFDLPDHLVLSGTPYVEILRFLACRGDFCPDELEHLVTSRLQPVIERLPYTLDRKFSRGTHLAITGSPLPSGGYIFTFTDVTERYQAAQRLEEMVVERTRSLEEANQQLDKLAQTDSLTQIVNRRYFDMAMKAEWARTDRNGLSFALLMIDVDSFKAYNDHYGHQAGDQCLLHIARVLKKRIRRSGDTLARYGGEEFAIILTNIEK